MDKIYRIFTLLCVGLIILCSGCNPATSGDSASWNPAIIVATRGELLHINVKTSNVVRMHIPYEYGEYDVIRFEDVEKGNTCYLFADYTGNLGTISGFSCVKGE